MLNALRSGSAANTPSKARYLLPKTVGAQEDSREQIDMGQAFTNPSMRPTSRCTAVTMRHLSLLIAALIFCAASSPASAQDSIETKSVVIPLASGWHEQPGSKPISAEGPNRELMKLTVVSAESSESLGSAESAAISALWSGAAGMKIVSPLKSFTLPSGTRVNELISQSEDGARVLVGTVLRGTSSIVLATLEGPSASGSVLAAARVQLLSLRWR